jgi:hypothetical protein
MMPYKTVTQQSDRGNLKDIQDKRNSSLEENPDMPPTSSELRIKSLYEHALVTRDQAMIESLGLIVIGGDPKNPVNIMRHREYVEELKIRLGSQIKETQEEIENFFTNDFWETSEMRVAAYKRDKARNAIFSEDGDIIKTASTGNTRHRSFWRVK